MDRKGAACAGAILLKVWRLSGVAHGPAAELFCTQQLTH
jgi:hypothetical protein